MNRTLLILILILPLLSSCKEEKSPAPNRPQARISASVDDDTLTVFVAIPEGTHAYLDRGREGVLIPVSFDWKDIKAKPVLAPDGEFDELVRATVFRGEGSFVFKVEDARTLKGSVFRVRTQLCNDELGICYPPSWQEVEIPG